MALTANRDVDRYVDQELREVPAATGVHIYKGALVEWNTGGYARPLAGTGQFAGLAYEEIDNSAGLDAAKRGRVFTRGDFAMTLAGAVAGDVGRNVYATDDATLTFNATGATFVGCVQAVTAAGAIVLRIGEAGSARTTALAHFTANFALSARQSGLVCTNLGAGATIVATLPQNPPAGTEFRFVCMADQAIQVAPGAAGGLYVKGAKQADNKFAAINDIGDFLHLVADGNGDWVAVASIQGAEADIAVEA
jgi:hypothetical protein